MSDHFGTLFIKGLKERLLHKCFPVNFEKCLRTLFSQKNRLLLNITTVVRNGKTFMTFITMLSCTINPGATRVGGGEGGQGGGLPCPFLKIEKSALILEKKALIVYILGLNLSFKMYFKKKSFKIFPCGSFFSCVLDEKSHRSVLIPRSLPCP